MFKCFQKVQESNEWARDSRGEFHWGEGLVLEWVAEGFQRTNIDPTVTSPKPDPDPELPPAPTLSRKTLVQLSIVESDERTYRSQIQTKQLQHWAELNYIRAVHLRFIKLYQSEVHSRQSILFDESGEWEAIKAMNLSKMPYY
eukprot:TRINITY_DN68205_c2_g2_i1.p1 TRINITY_DN68205_c2_g2~~TRINITY_DN68205_c2_g2_i1.p1  ORF type:complete len:143 (-),score=0.73 TRINITY_DN68205_c2_g2_i1:294-722(-)